MIGVPSGAVAVAGESAGGNLAAAVALRMRDAGGPVLAGQVLVYPAVAGAETSASRRQFDGLIISGAQMEYFWTAYSGGRAVDRDPYAAPLHAPDLGGLPPAHVVLGGCDVLRDEGRAYATRLRDAGVPLEVVVYRGQPHGFVNFGFPQARPAFDAIGAWLRRQFAAVP